MVIVLFVIIYFICNCRVHPVTTVLIVSHAEKGILPPSDPPLSPEGLVRAQTLVHVLGLTRSKAIFATEILNTQETVEPLASQLGLTVIEVSANDIEGLVDQRKADYSSEVVVIAGHSNTIPQIIEKFGGNSIEPIP